MLFPFPVSPSISSLSIPLPFFYKGIPPPKPLPLLPPHPDILLHWGGPALAGPRGSPPIGAQQGHPLLHMQLEPWVCPCVLFGWWFSPWELWLVGIVVLMGLQAHSAPSILSLTPPTGTLFSVPWLAASIHLCICHALAVPLRRQRYQAPVSVHFLASAILSRFGVCMYMGWIPRWDSSEWPFFQSLLQNLSPYPLL